MPGHKGITCAADLECEMTEPTINDADDVTYVDCETCCARGLECDDCVITFLLGAPPSGVEIGGEERRAIEALAAGGLIPPLRLVTPDDSPPAHSSPAHRFEAREA